jgi:hypothetical protein
LTYWDRVSHRLYRPLKIGQLLSEVQVQREAQMSLPTRVRRLLSRFMIVLVVSLSIEALVAVFQFNRAHPEYLPDTVGELQSMVFQRVS